MMKTVLCFGDSNTWGFDPAGMGAPFPTRLPPDVRWTGVLAKHLGPDWRVIEEGQNGRTTVHEDPFNVARNGKLYLPACLESHKPINLVVMMLGTNDLKAVYNLPPADIANGVAVLARMILGSDAGPGNKPPKLLLICPPKTADLAKWPDLAERVPNGAERSARLPQYYAMVAQTLGCAFLDSQGIAAPSDADGIHLDAGAHAKLGAAIADKILSMPL
jgi:lysophospholipase L1-like esterase